MTLKTLAAAASIFAVVACNNEEGRTFTIAGPDETAQDSVETVQQKLTVMRSPTSADTILSADKTPIYGEIVVIYDIPKTPDLEKKSAAFGEMVFEAAKEFYASRPANQLGDAHNQILIAVTNRLIQSKTKLTITSFDASGMKPAAPAAIPTVQP